MWRKCSGVKLYAITIILVPSDGLNYVATWNAAMLMSDDLHRAMLAGTSSQRPPVQGLGATTDVSKTVLTLPSAWMTS